MFVISKKGKIEGLRMRGPDSLLEKEVARIIGRLPKMKPGKHKGKKVDVPFSIPVEFKLKGKTDARSDIDEKVSTLTQQYNQLIKERNRLLQSSNENNPIIINLKEKLKILRSQMGVESSIDFSNGSLTSQINQLLAERGRLLQSAAENNPIIVNLDRQLNELKKSLHNQLPSNTDKIKTALIESDKDVDLPFSVVENVPVFPSCENETDKRACFNKMMQEHIAKNFRYPEEAHEKGIQGRVSIMITIDKKGKITNIRKRGPDKLLEDEAERIMKLLPLMTPGKHRGKAVNVPFSIPITFKLQGTPYKFQDIRLSNETGSEPIFTNDGNGLNYRKTYALEPMFLIDGKESSKDAVGIINPDDIESMSVLKGEAAKSAYGEKAKNGVIVITTKKKE